jgi:hypothetical protein
LSRATYCEQNIYYIHEAENNVGYLRLVVPVTRKYQQGRHNVVREHLPVVFSSLLNVDHKDLLKPKSILYENIPFC